MAGSLDSLADLLSKLRISADPVVILKEVRTAVLSLPADELEYLARNVSLAPVFDSLNASNKEQISLACDLLTSMLSSLPASAIVPQFQAELYRGLLHPNPLVKEMVLKQIERCAAHNYLLENTNDALLEIVQLCSDDNLSLAKHAVATLVEMSKSRAGLNLLFAPLVIQEIKKNMMRNDTVRFRMHEVIVKIAKASVDGLNMCVDSELLAVLMNEYQQNDVLIQLNCLELLSELAVMDHTLYHLEQQGVISNLEKMLQNETANPTSGFLLPGLIKFFGNMGHLRPKEVCERYPSFMNILFKYIQANEQTIFLVAIETISMVGSSVEGKLTLDKFQSLMKTCMNKMGSVISNAPSDLRVKAINAATLLLNLKVEDQTTELLAITETWFSELSKEPMQLILNLCRQPFIDIRCSALGVLRALCVQPWGQRKMSLYPGFIEYLLDRNTEPDKEGKELKYEIITILVNSPTSLEIFGTNAMKKINDFCKEGPYYVVAQAEVAIDGAS